MKRKIFLGLLILLITSSCSNKNEEEKSIKAPLLTDNEEQERAAADKNHQDDMYHYPEIISKSAPNLRLIKNRWTSKAILCSESEEFLLVRKTIEDRFIAISTEDTEDYTSFQFYDFDIDGKIIHKSPLYEADYSIDNRYNFVISADSIFYYIRNEKNIKVFAYSLTHHNHSEVSSSKMSPEQKVDWEIEFGYTSPNDNLEITLRDVRLILNQKGRSSDTLINQVYDGTWSFRQGVWNDGSTKFYFDNSGSVACIWEVDIENKTLDKIVADHRARSPVHVSGNPDAIMYIVERCVYMTRKANSGD